jgi:hypothetical protein
VEVPSSRNCNEIIISNGGGGVVEVGSELSRCPRVLDENRYDLARRPIGPFSRTNEAAVLDTLAQVARATLARYPTTYDEDVAELYRTAVPLPPFSNRRNLLVLLIGEKSVSIFCEKLAKDASVWLRSVDAPDVTLASVKAAAALGEMMGAGRACYERDLARYCRAVIIPLLEAQVAAITTGHVVAASVI